MVSFSDWFLWDLRLKRECALGDLQEGQREAGGAGSLKGARKAVFQVGLFLKKKNHLGLCNMFLEGVWNPIYKKLTICIFDSLKAIRNTKQMVQHCRFPFSYCLNTRDQ